MLEFQDVVIKNGEYLLNVDDQRVECASLGVMGPSGGGKSTLLAAIAGFLPLKSGIIRFRGEVISCLKPSARPVAMIFQSHNLFPALSVAQNLALGHKAPQNRVKEICEFVGIDGLENRFPREISGGQAARVAIARILLQEKPLVLLDEPFAALGPFQTRTLNELIRKSSEKFHKMTILVDHTPENLKNHCDMMLWIDQNGAKAAQETKKFFENPQEAVRNYL